MWFAESEGISPLFLYLKTCPGIDSVNGIHLCIEASSMLDFSDSPEDSCVHHRRDQDLNKILLGSHYFPPLLSNVTDKMTLHFASVKGIILIQILS